MAKKTKQQQDVVSAVEPQTATATTEAKPEREQPATTTAKPKRNAFGFTVYEGGIGHGDAR